VLVGMVGRFFPLNWRPPADEIRFAAEHGFGALQIRSDRPGAIAEYLRADLRDVGASFRAEGVEPVLEMLVAFQGEPGTIPAALAANLPAIESLGVRRVHVHPVGRADVEPLLLDEFGAALAIADRAGLVFGVEHNAPSHHLLVAPATVGALLAALPGLQFVWDVNHTRPGELDAFLAFTDRLSLVHVSDTPLPETNHHLPLGRGSVDLTLLRGLTVPLILEIGGLPLSGGYGLDTDEALIDSRAKLGLVRAEAAPAPAPADRRRP
jgi:sugar phosphate isomerase/epimerase